MQQWDPKLKDKGSASLYGATMERIKANGGKVAGILWYQGESDCNPDDARAYDARMTELVNAFRSDLGQPDLPFYLVQLGIWVSDGANGGNESWNSIRETERTWAAKTPNVGMVSAIDMTLDDGIHLSAASQKRLGKRLADVVSGNPSPDFVSAAFEDNYNKVRVTFKNVRGGLTSQGAPVGFSFRKPNGDEIMCLYKVVLDGDSAVLSHDYAIEVSGSDLYYGWGTRPYANITDGAGAAVPAFGPVKI